MHMGFATFGEANLQAQDVRQDKHDRREGVAMESSLGSSSCLCVGLAAEAQSLHAYFIGILQLDAGDHSYSFSDSSLLGRYITKLWCHLEYQL